MRGIATGKYRDWITEDGIDTIRGWARDGFSDTQIAKNIGVSRQQFYEWQKRFPDILDALKKGRKPVAVQLEDALYKAGLGYDYEETIEEIYEEEGVKRKHIRRIKKHAQPNVIALIFALKNLKKHKFKDKPVEEIERADDILIETLRRWDNAAKQSGESETT